jgi:polysaccharide export outer membrane protein
VFAGSLAGCVTSSDDVGGTGVAAFDFQPRAVGSAPKAPRDSDAFAAGATARNSAYKVGSLDVLDISVFKVPELSKIVQVADTGTINLPLLGEVPAAGRTAQEIEQDLTRKLGAKYLNSPQVTVFVKEHNSQRVTVEGAVRKPGVYPIRGKLSLVQLLATAEGVDKETYSKDVTVFRTVDGERTSRVFDIDEIRAGKADDPTLRQGDLVVVETSTAKTAFQNTIKILPAAAALRPTVW